MQRWFAAKRPIARHFALGIALTGLMLTLLAATLLVFPYKLAANPEVQSELLYDVLGNLEYSADGRFGAIDDPFMRQRLANLVIENRLNGRGGVAYIVNLNNGEIMWHSAAMPNGFVVPEVDNAYTMQFLQTASHQLAVQNFWLKNAGNARIEFRMVVALSVH
jgi:hypothetical protein